MLNWPDLYFYPINLWTAPKLSKGRHMSNCRERIDDDIDYLYERAEKIGRRPTELQEEQFCDRVFDLLRTKEINDFEARRVAFLELFDLDL